MPYKYTYKVPERFNKIIRNLDEFKDGVMCVTVVLKNGEECKVLILMYDKIIATKKYDYMPFDPEEIERIYQTDDDLYPKDIKDWDIFRREKRVVRRDGFRTKSQ